MKASNRLFTSCFALSLASILGVGCSSSDSPAAAAGESSSTPLSNLNHRVSACGGFEAKTDAPGKSYCSEEVLRWTYDAASSRLSLIDQRVPLNCCGKRSLAVNFDEVRKVFVAKVTDEPDPSRCRCMCSFDLAVDVDGIRGASIPLELVRFVQEDGTPKTIWTGTLDLSQPSGSIVVDAAASGCDDEPLEITCGSKELHDAEHGTCEAMNVEGSGQCYCMLGYYWNGTECTSLSGACSCVGQDCDKLAQSAEECQAQHKTCFSQDKTIACGDSKLFSAQHQVCEGMDIKGEGACKCMLGYFWNGTACTSLSGACSCVGQDCDKLAQTAEECEAQHKACFSQDKTIACGDSKLFSTQHQVCEGMDIKGEGTCNCMLGYFWNGSDCTSLSGACSCIGEDCDKLTRDLATCEALHSSC